MEDVYIVDYGAGNIGSVINLVKKVGGRPHVVASSGDVLGAQKLILPGVGSFDSGMSKLEGSGLIPVLEHRVKIDKVPIMGICLGAQLFTRSSEEGVLPGLGWLDADTVKFRMEDTGLKVPHMGWNNIALKREHAIFHQMYPDPKFYFVHKYYMSADMPETVLCSTNYGFEFASGLCHENILGFQFHPEKSHKYGMKIMENFLKI